MADGKNDTAAYKWDQYKPSKIYARAYVCNKTHHTWCSGVLHLVIPNERNAYVGDGSRRNDVSQNRVDRCYAK